ncbi:MAG: DUF3108 domain-containing protein [Prolixibacteraceae bacterium]|jgi:hypothetical protein|nr:DUF3108 domain-containing protein [Prolixibacteraceae bacterium]MBT6764990.1 DUF3108 domain-containing protein [Prolixibacteraceae bacterium]MBT6999218.1 DUF3108 domain-containing protein [Prolixibacteraceae bacterium]MBT7393299.1 DUF3108 domain-containing protein [Prolixibacteraceae bacterium]
MKKIFIIYFLLLIIPLAVFAKQEIISFNLKFGIIKGGEAQLIISDTIFNGNKAIHYYLVGRTTGFTDKLFGVNDVYETIVDAETQLPLKVIRNIKEKKYRWYNETHFYHNIDSINSQRSGWKKVPANLLDIVSVFFYFINNHVTEKMETSEKVTLPTFHADKISDVSVKYIGSQKIETGLGETDCYVLAPQVDKGKLLNRADGLKILISKDNRVPVLLEFDMRVGALRALLKSYKINGVEQITK